MGEAVWKFNETFQVWLWGSEANGCVLHKEEESGWIGYVAIDGKVVRRSGPLCDLEWAKVEVVEEFKRVHQGELND